MKDAKKNSNPKLLQLVQVLHEEDYFINLVLLNWRQWRGLDYLNKYIVSHELADEWHHFLYKKFYTLIYILSFFVELRQRTNALYDFKTEKNDQEHCSSDKPQWIEANTVDYLSI